MGWSRPSEPGARDETFLEFQYRLQLTKTLELSPDIQIVLNPGSNRGTDTIVVPGIRLTMVF